MHWNMARFAEALLPAIHRVSPDDVEAAKALVDAIPRRFRAAWHARVREKLGLSGAGTDDGALIDSLFDELETHQVDFTSFFRALAMLLRGDGAMLESLLPSADVMAPWIAAWWRRIEQDAGNPLEIANAKIGRASGRERVCQYV